MLCFVLVFSFAQRHSEMFNRILLKCSGNLTPFGTTLLFPSLEPPKHPNLAMHTMRGELLQKSLLAQTNFLPNLSHVWSKTQIANIPQLMGSMMIGTTKA